MFTMIIIIVAAAFWLSIVAVAIAMPINVQILRITKPFVCPGGSTMEIKTEKTSGQRTGGKGLVVLCRSAEGTKDVKGKALTVLWGIFFVVFLAGSALAASLWWAQIYHLLFG